MDDLHWKVLSLSECKWSDRKPIFLNENERFAVLFAEREKLFAELFYRVKYESVMRKRWSTKAPAKGKVQSKALLSRMMINDCHESISSTACNLKKMLRQPQKHRHEEEFNKKSFFIFPFSVSPSSMGSSQSGFWVVRKARRKRFIKMCCSKAYWFRWEGVWGRLFISVI